MKAKTFLLMLVLGMVCLSACKKEAIIEIDETFDLVFGSTFVIENEALSIHFADVVTSAFDIWLNGGDDLYPKLDITTADGVVHELEFLTSTFNVIDGYIIEVLSMESGPEGVIMPPKEDYVVKLSVRSL